MTIPTMLRAHAAALMIFGLLAPAVAAVTTSSTDETRSGAPRSQATQVRLAQAVVVPDGRFNSMVDFLAGTWQWDRAEPRETMQMQFSRKGTFFYNNLTTGLTHYGSYKADATDMNITVNRSCSGGNCEDRRPPRNFKYPLKPANTNEFFSGGEDWKRLKRE